MLGCQAVPVDYQDFASEAEETAYLIADNRIAELAEMDNAAIKDLLAELDTGSTDMELTGYDHEALENLMTQTAPAEKVEELKPIKKLHVLISMTSDQGLYLLPKIQEMATTAGAKVHNAGN